MMGFDEVEEINSLVEELGVDAENLHGLMAWAMDLYDNGIITGNDLGGIDLKWGDRDATMELLKKIVYKDGKAPAALAEGWRHAIEVFGPESEWYAWYSSANQSIARYEPRSKEHGLGIAHGTGHGGGSGLFDAATMCIFSAFAFFEIWGPPQEVARTFLSAAAGWELDFRQINEMMQRIDYFSRCLSLREGFNPDAHTFLPPRAFSEPVTNKYGITSVWTEEEWSAARNNFYARANLTENGLPIREDLLRLGLEFVIPVLEPMDIISDK
jgi:aldehyde:ferredoxin oxidoreductase